MRRHSRRSIPPRNADAAQAKLDAFEASELGQRYPDVVRSRRAKQNLVIPFLAFSAPLRKVLYTTHAFERLNSSVRRAVKTRGHFTSERAACKLIYLALREATDKWQAPLNDWHAAKREFAIYFGERFNASQRYLRHDETAMLAFNPLLPSRGCGFNNSRKF